MHLQMESLLLLIMRSSSQPAFAKLFFMRINELDESFHAHLGIVGNAIYLRGDKHLFCFANPLAERSDQESKSITMSLPHPKQKPLTNE